ncbi:MAG: hypothetical protein H6652_16880 [Ardenticatenaceae bacterium]|nr:hypothetical protein [Ardenticatenaceae bacterium]MCB8948808.1 hypothetical protein [Ardenticatenaceae bacterium]
MQKSTKRKLLIISSLAVLLSIVFVWGSTAQLDEYFRMFKRDTESEVAVAFALALIKNHSAAYEIADADMKSQIDEWMTTRQPPNCTNETYFFYGHSGDGVFDVFYDCYTRDGAQYFFTITHIKIEELKIVDFASVSERVN